MAKLGQSRIVNGYFPGCIVDLGLRCAKLMPGDKLSYNGMKWEVVEKRQSPFFGRVRLVIKPHKDTLI